MTIHITTSDELGRVVRRGLREPVCSVSDNWLVGPCATAAQAHVQARCELWGLRGRERTRFLGAFHKTLAALESHERVLLWTSPLWSDRTASWALCAWRLASRPAEPGIDLAVLDDAQAAAGGFGHQHIHVRPADARRGREAVRSLSLTRVREMARLWRRLCGTSPVLAVESTSASEPLLAMGAYQAGFFPRLTERGPGLSRFDELLLSCVGEGWSTPLDVFVSPGATGDELRKWLSLTGDVLLAERLAQWATHRGGESALDSEPFQTENAMKAARYRLSEAGHALLRRGLTHVDRGAPLRVWGATAYEPMVPWVVVEKDAGQQRCVLLPGSATHA